MEGERNRSMNYQKHYALLIQRAQTREKPICYVERHHIIPLCLAGENKKSNVVALTAEEHFVAHQLLTKIHPQNRKLMFALNRMTHSAPDNVRNNKMYGWIHNKFSRMMMGNTFMDGYVASDEARARISASLKGNDRAKGGVRTSAHRAAISAAHTGCKRSDETRAKMRLAAQNRVVSDETRAILKAAWERRKHLPSPLKGVPLSEERRAKLREGKRKRTPAQWEVSEAKRAASIAARKAATC